MGVPWRAVHTFDPITNRLKGITGPAGYNFAYDYDDQGNVKQRGAQRYVFGQGNRMKEATGKATYVYDGWGHRSSVVGTDGLNRMYVYTQDGKLMYSGPTSGAKRKYIYLHNHMIAEDGDAGLEYVHTDALGSPVVRTSGNAALISRTRYEPYGLTAMGAEPTIGFTGHVNDFATGLVYMQQRYYDPIAGRMLSIDPVTTDANNGSSFNRYAYANNSPYKYVDPDGRQAAEKFVEQHRKDMEAGNGKVYEPLMPVAVVGTVAMAVGPVAVAAVKTLATGATQATTQVVSKTETILTSPKNLLPTQPKSDLTGSVVNRIAKDMKQNGFDPTKPISGQTTCCGLICPDTSIGEKSTI